MAPEKVQGPADRYRAARDRGGTYLLGRLGPDGGLAQPGRGLADYYKLPLALSVCGHGRAAGRLLDWVRRHGLLPDGDFGYRPAAAHGYFHTYYNTWLVLGAHRLGQFDLARRGLEFLERTWDPESGGFFSSATERAAQTPQDIWVTCGCGLAALYAGRIQVASGVGRWLARLRELQPDFPRRLFAVWSPAGGLHTAFPPAERVRHEFVPAEPTNQYFFQPGIAAGFLARLFLATGEQAWLDLAQNYLSQATLACDHHFTNYQSGKVGWAGALLFRLTGKPAWGGLAGRVGDWLATVQRADGAWDAGEHTDDFTAEMVVWLDEIDQALGG